MLRKFRRTINQLIRRDLLGRISQALFKSEEGFFTEWKLGNTPKEKSRNPAFGGVFFCLITVVSNITALLDDSHYLSH